MVTHPASSHQPARLDPRTGAELAQHRSTVLLTGAFAATEYVVIYE
jgi:hypothetical protein